MTDNLLDVLNVKDLPDPVISISSRFVAITFPRVISVVFKKVGPAGYLLEKVTGWDGARLISIHKDWEDTWHIYLADYPAIVVDLNSGYIFSNGREWKIQ